MEIEAKFALPHRQVFRRLQTTDHLAGFALSSGRTKRVQDTYLDTAGHLILTAGYACRQREQEEGVLITLKSLSGTEGAVHRREEWEVLMAAGQPVHPVTRWPAGPVRDRVCQMTGEEALTPLFTLQQTRFVRRVTQAGRQVAELSLDEVHLASGDRELTFLELEVELAAQGLEDDLAIMANCLQDEWGLSPEPRSKFERALAFLEETPVKDALLTPRERALCRQIATQKDLYRRRALALLALDEGMTQAKAGEHAGLSARRVRYWLAQFRQKRLDILPTHVLEQAATWAKTTSPEPPPQPQAPPEQKESPQPWSLETLFERHGIDQAHARTVADHALALFDLLAPFHNLPPERRSLLETAALLHDIGLQTDLDRHHVAGRDILLAHPPAELDDPERLIVALIAFLHRKPVTSKKLKKLAKGAFANLSEPARAEALALAALVRLADGLDYSRTGTTWQAQSRQQEKAVEIKTAGPHAATDAGQAQAKSDLWRQLFETDLIFESPQGTRIAVAEPSAGPAPRSLPDGPGLEADDSMAEAARKTLYFHLQRMLYHEPGTRQGKDIEELHDMRVATRRMRAAFDVFGKYLDPEQVTPFIKDLRRTGRALGAVRDLDVFWEKTQHYLDTLPSDRQAGLEPLRIVWEAERQRDRKQMLAYLDSERYQKFKETFGEFLQTPGAGALPVLSRQNEPLPHRLRHVVPVAVYQRLAAVRAYDEWVTGSNVPLERLHQLRIAAKGLRYTLEYFREVLSPDSKKTIDQIKTLQDHLGDLQDAVVASNLLRDFLTYGTWGRVKTSKKKASRFTEPVIAPGVAAYLTVRQTELQNLIETFPQTWAKFQSPQFNQLVNSIVAGL